MILISALTFFVGTLLASAMRHTVDLQDMSQVMANSNLTRAHVQVSRRSQVTASEQPAIFGHASLNTVKVYHLQADSDKCHGIVQKVTDFAKEELTYSEDEGRDIDVSVDQSFLHDKGTTGSQTLLEAFAVLDQLDLRDSMQTGEVWTLGNQDTLIECETNRSIRLEEEHQTDDGAELLQGDMLVPEDLGSFLQVDPDLSLLQTKTLIAEGARWGGKLWSSQVFYCFHPNIEEHAKNAFLAAIEHTSLQVPCLSFVNVGFNDGSPNSSLPPEIGEDKKGMPGSCLASPSILVQSTDRWKCWSYVGRRTSFQLESKSQPLNLGTPCSTMAVAAHELGHTLGMVHEMSRPDRDKYVTVHWENIQTGGQRNFNKMVQAVQLDVYDVLSLMQYAPDAFAVEEGKPTMTAINPKLTRLFGQRQGWSEQDVHELYNKYCRNVWGRLLPEFKPHPLVSQRDILTRLVGDYKLESVFPQLVEPPQTDGTYQWEVSFDREKSETVITTFKVCRRSLLGMPSVELKDLRPEWREPSDKCDLCNRLSLTSVLIACPGLQIETFEPNSCYSRDSKLIPKEFWTHLDTGTCGVSYTDWESPFNEIIVGY